jgi:hypothetical protein
MKLSQKDRELGRVIARGMNDIKVERKKTMTKQAESRKAQLEQQAERALSGGSAM